MSRAILWLRDDLRISDNPALDAALKSGLPIKALYVHDTNPALRPMGGAARWWLKRSLAAFRDSLDDLGIMLEEAAGDSRTVLDEDIRAGATAIFWTRRYHPAERGVDEEIKSACRAAGVAATSFAGNVLVEPSAIATQAGTPFSVFTPFWSALRKRDIAIPIVAPPSARMGSVAGAELRPGEPKWSAGLARHWQVGETAAHAELDAFITFKLETYEADRDTPGIAGTSRLSPRLRFGEISARQIWHAVLRKVSVEPSLARGGEKFLSELAWRDFSYHLLYHRKDITNEPMQAKYRDMPWRRDEAGLRAWQRGTTGLPIVDAGMRQLWETGWMHNRVRMLVASLLAKNLLIDWRLGEQWFWDTLVDADPASNPASWQWVAGSGADAAPYFRIFNPVTQGERFDADGDYVREWVPELAGLPDEWVQKPHEAPEAALRQAGVVLGRDYPKPIVDLKTSRARALGALKGDQALG